MTSKISWLQKNPNIIGEGVEAKTIVEVEKKTSIIPNKN